MYSSIRALILLIAAAAMLAACSMDKSDQDQVFENWLLVPRHEPAQLLQHFVRLTILSATNQGGQSLQSLTHVGNATAVQ